MDWSTSYGQIPRCIIDGDKLNIYFATRSKSDNNGNFVSYVGKLSLNVNDPFKVICRNKNPSFSPGPKGSFYEYGVMPGHVFRDYSGEVQMYFTGWSRPKGSLPYETWIGKVSSFDNGETFNKNTTIQLIHRNNVNKNLVNGPHVFINNGVEYLMYASGDRWIKSEGILENVYTLKIAETKKIKDGFVLKHWKFSNTKRDICENAGFVFEHNYCKYVIYSERPSTNFRNGDGYRLLISKLNGIKIEETYFLKFKKYEDWFSEMQCYASVIQIGNKKYILFSGNYFGKVGFGIGELKVE